MHNGYFVSMTTEYFVLFGRSRALQRCQTSTHASWATLDHAPWDPAHHGELRNAIALLHPCAPCYTLLEDWMLYKL